MLRPALHTAHNIPIINRWQKLIALGLFIIMIGSSQSGAQSIGGNISIERGGQVWIEGSAGIVNYQCRAEELSGMGEIENAEQPQSTVRGHGDVHISVELPVKTLNCGKRAMNNDMYEALKAEEFPTIKYKLLDATLAKTQDADSTDSWMKIKTRGVMEIAGIEDTVTMFVKGKVLSGREFRVKGSQLVHMDTYHIKPPSAMFGLIRADKKLTVHFDVTVQLEQQGRYLDN